MKPAIIIPVYNHRQQLAQVIERTLQLGLPIFVIDDGSTDGTGPLLDGMKGITLLRHAQNLGKGAAILTGFSAAEEQGCDVVVTLDGDGQHCPEDAERLLAAAVQGGRCLVIGKRLGMEAGGNVPWSSRFGRKFSNFWVRVSGGPVLSDSQSGFRVYPLPEAAQLDVKARRYQFEVEILVKARQQGLKTIEVPVRVVYQPQGERVSHFRPWRDFLRNTSTFSRLISLRIFTLLFNK